MADPPVILFDSDCVLCSGMVAFVLRHERDHDLHFAGAWSAEGLAMAGRHGYTRADLNRTVIVIEDGRPLTRTAAVFAIARHLRWPWRTLAGIAALVPRPLRDRAYDAIAHNRYRWFGRRDNCAIVPPDQRGRFHGL